MKKSLIASILLSFLICYLQWPNNSMFIGEVEWNLLFNYGNKQDNFMHPAIALPFLGQILLIISLFQKEPGSKLSITGIILMGILVLLLLLIGVLGLNIKIILSTLPFLGFTTLYFLANRKLKYKDS